MPLWPLHPDPCMFTSFRYTPAGCLCELMLVPQWRDGVVSSVPPPWRMLTFHFLTQQLYLTHMHVSLVTSYTQISTGLALFLLWCLNYQGCKVTSILTAIDFRFYEVSKPTFHLCIHCSIQNFICSHSLYNNKQRNSSDIHFIFYFKIVSQQGETQRSPEGSKPIEPSRTEAPLIIAMSLCCRTRRIVKRRKRKQGRGQGGTQPSETQTHSLLGTHLQKELREKQWRWF